MSQVQVSLRRSSAFRAHPRRCPDAWGSGASRLGRALAVVGAVGAVLVSGAARGEYVARFAATARGALTMTGNSLGLSSDGANGPGTVGSIGAFVTTDVSSAAPGGWPPGTTAAWEDNAAAAELRVPEGAEVLHAELVWGAYCEDLPAIVGEAVWVTPPGGVPVAVDPAAGVAFDDTTKDFYARAVDVTALVVAAGPGTWTVGHVPASLACGSDCNLRSAGWTLIVAYGRADLPLRDLGIWVGLEPGGGAPATLAGLCTPTSGDVRARVLVSALEGDFQGYGDNLAFGPVGGPLTNLSGPNNTIGNFFAAHINGDDGRLDTSGTFGTANLVSGGTTPGRQGWDLTNVDASGVLVAGETAAAAQGITSNEQYRVTVMGLAIETGQPRFEAPATGASVAPTSVVAGETATLTWNVVNGGAEVAVAPWLEVALGEGWDVVAGSVVVDGVARPEVDPEAAGIALPELVPGASAAVTVAATVGAVAAGAEVLSAEGRLTWEYMACGVTASGEAVVAPAPVGAARLEVAVASKALGAIAPGNVVELEVTVTNAGAGATRASRLALAWPAGLAYVAGSTRVGGASRADVEGASPFAVAAPIGAGDGVLAPHESVVVRWRLSAEASDVRRDLPVSATARGHEAQDASEVQAETVVIVTVCGDGLVGGAEACDDGALNSDSAADACRTDCTGARCGDGVVDTLEACDAGGEPPGACAYGEESCAVCGLDCAWGSGAVRRCGDGTRDADDGEGCDDGEANSDVEADACRSDCQPARCGDGVQDAGERCDDGNLDEDDGCNTQCDDRRCGNGRVEAGEVCDPGPEPATPCPYGDASCVRCEADCGGYVPDAASSCGDGRLDPAHGEQCDDGNAQAELCSYGLRSCAVCGAECRPVAGTPTYCGDGSVDSVNGERCDDGNTVDGDGCSALCVPDEVRRGRDEGCAGGASGRGTAWTLGAFAAMVFARRRRRRLGSGAP